MNNHKRRATELDGFCTGKLGSMEKLRLWEQISMPRLLVFLENGIYFTNICCKCVLGSLYIKYTWETGVCLSGAYILVR